MSGNKNKQIKCLRERHHKRKEYIVKQTKRKYLPQREKKYFPDSLRDRTCGNLSTKKECNNERSRGRILNSHTLHTPLFQSDISQNNPQKKRKFKIANK